MDSTFNLQPVSPFFEEVGLWLKSLTSALPGSTVYEPQPGTFEIDNPPKSTLLIVLKPLYKEKRETEKGLSQSSDPFLPTATFCLWEDVWYTRRDVVQSRIRAILGLSQRIPGRVTEVRKIDRPTTTHFLQNNHLQGAVLSKYKFGLFLPRRYYRVLDHPEAILPADDTSQELLVAVATFAHPRTFIRNGLPHRSFELVRFANLKNTTVVGGMDKLLKHFIRHYQPDDLMTYVDLEGSTGKSYLRLGFEPHADTPPLDFWVHGPTWERYLPHRLPEGITEESAPTHGYVKIQNGGSRKFVKLIEKNPDL